MPLATILGIPSTTLQPATAGRELTSTASLPTVSEMPAPPTGTKQWHCSSDWEATTPRPEEEKAQGLDIMPEEWPHQRQKEGRPPARLLKECCWKAFGKDFKFIQVTRWVYFKTHHPNYDHKGTHNLPTPSRKWPPLLVSWALMATRFSWCGLAEKTSGLLTAWQKAPQRTSISSR